jgi:hypothetical protein
MQVKPLVALTQQDLYRKALLLSQPGVQKVPLLLLCLTSSLHRPRGMPTAYTRFRCTTRTCCNQHTGQRSQAVVQFVAEWWEVQSVLLACSQYAMGAREQAWLRRDATSII